MGDSPPLKFPWERCGFGAVNRCAVHLHPFAHALQSLDAFWRDGAVAARSNIEQKVTTLRGDVAQHANEFLRTLPIVIRRLETPRVIHGHARFPVLARHAIWWNGLLRRSVVAAGRLIFGESLHSGAATVDAIVHNDLWLNGAHEVISGLAPSMVPGVFPFTIEPHNADFAVIGKDFLELRLHVVHIAWIALWIHCTLVPRTAR